MSVVSECNVQERGRVELGPTAGLVAVVCRSGEAAVALIDLIRPENPDGLDLSEIAPNVAVRAPGRYTCAFLFCAPGVSNCADGFIDTDSDAWTESTSTAELDAAIDTGDAAAVQAAIDTQLVRRRSQLKVELHASGALDDALGSGSFEALRDDPDLLEELHAAHRAMIDEARPLPDILRRLFFPSPVERLESEATELLTIVSTFTDDALSAVESRLQKLNAAQPSPIAAAKLKAIIVDVVEREKKKRNQSQADAAKSAQHAVLMDSVKKALDFPGKLEFLRIEQFGWTGASYRLHFRRGGREVSVEVESTSQLNSRTRMNDALGEQLHSRVLCNQKEWRDVAFSLLQLARVVETTGEDEVTREWVRKYVHDYLGKASRYDPKQAVRLMVRVETEERSAGRLMLRDGDSFVGDDARLYLNAAAFAQFVANELRSERNERIVCRRLAKIGFAREKIQVREAKTSRRFLVGKLPNDE